MSPIISEPNIHVRIGISTPSAGLNEPPEFSYKNDPMTPEIAPTYMIPGIPRLRLPDFSLRVSPMQPSSSGTLCTIALGINVTIKLSIVRLLSV
jgi:hypothetical protein